ncbi:uncharacterized protein LOC132868911 isoform X3 [Neoarius graeffei]|uniref:uncharacterized protein LOC132868911 isoform X3 n=1 Tax=Neoarius graeffei TaxID=443677 RepID=UPI00298C561B|nr:uncharacterized protein LOC132868911 isoform X3 [Neoarius graeffei]
MAAPSEFMPRFNLKDGEDLEDFIESTDSENTKKQIKYGLAIFKEYCSLAEVNYEELDNSQLDKLLSRFYAGARSKKGADYCAKTMHSIRFALQRHFLAARRTDIRSQDFSVSNRTFKATLGKLKSKGKASVQHHPPVSPADMRLIQASLDLSKPKELQQKVFVDCMIYFTNRGREKLRGMRPHDFVLHEENGHEFFTLRVVNPKNHQAEAAEESQGGQMHEIPGNLRCPVKTLKKYLGKLNPLCDYFWQRPKQRVDEDNSVWYDHVPLGKNTLESMTKKISEAAGCSKKYTNHSLRATSITILDHAGYPYRDIMTISGHRSEASIKNYAGKKKEMSNTLSAKIQFSGSKPSEFVEDVPIDDQPSTSDNFDSMFDDTDDNLSTDSQLEAGIMSSSGDTWRSFRKSQAPDPDPSQLCENVKTETSDGRTSEVSEVCVKKEETLELNIYNHGDCELCKSFFFNKCELHGPPLFIPDSPIPMGVSDRARQTLPPGLEIRKSGIPDAGLGVFNMGETFPVGTHFGPCQGELGDREEAMNSEYSWVESEDAETGPELETGRDAQQTQEEESESEDQQGEAELDVFENQMPHASGSQQTTKSLKGRRLVDLDSDQEEELVEWYISHPEMYDHNNKNYKRSDKKNKLLQEKAKEMGLMVRDIVTWFKTQRTAFTRLKSGKNGQAKHPLTHRAQWVQDKFQFLAPHLRMRKNVTSFPPLPSPTQNSDDDQEVAMAESSDAPPSSVQGSQSQPKRKGKSSVELAVVQLAQQISSRALHTSCRDKVMVTDTRSAWANWVVAELKDLNNEEWMEFQQEVISIMYKHKKMNIARRNLAMSQRFDPTSAQPGIPHPPRPSSAPVSGSPFGLYQATRQPMMPPPPPHQQYPPF